MQLFQSFWPSLLHSQKTKIAAYNDLHGFAHCSEMRNNPFFFGIGNGMKHLKVENKRKRNNQHHPGLYTLLNK